MKWLIISSMYTCLYTVYTAYRIYIILTVTSHDDMLKTVCINSKYIILIEVNGYFSVIGVCDLFKCLSEWEESLWEETVVFVVQSSVATTRGDKKGCDDSAVMFPGCFLNLDV